MGKTYRAQGAVEVHFMLNFTVGPVMADPEILELGREQVPYFRTPEFSQLMLENEALMCRFAKAAPESRAVFLTGSGTASMEAAVMNLFTAEDRVLVVDGGSFGHRFCQLCQLHGVPYTPISLPYGHTLTEEALSAYDPADYTGFLVNVHETSTGVHYDMELIHRFCQKNDLLLVVDAVSSFLADEFRMADWGVNVMLTGSQKALAVPPGVSILVLDRRAQEKIAHTDVRSMYFNLADALKNGERGQTPFTPAVGTLIQIHHRLQQIEAAGGVEAETARIAAQAADFRAKVAGLPFEIVSDALSNCVTPLHPTLGVSAYSIFTCLKDEYGIFVCPNGGELADRVFRVGHIGHLTAADNDTLIAALQDMNRRGLL
jgi:aspartate aminotransferase-like enzyme